MLAKLSSLCLTFSTTSGLFHALKVPTPYLKYTVCKLHNKPKYQNLLRCMSYSSHTSKSSQLFIHSYQRNSPTNLIYNSIRNYSLPSSNDNKSDDPEDDSSEISESS